MMADRWVVLYHLQSTFNPHNSSANIVLSSVPVLSLGEVRLRAVSLASGHIIITKMELGPEPSS